MDATRTLPAKSAIIALLTVAAVEMAIRPLLPSDAGVKMAAIGGLRSVEALGLLGWLARSSSGLPAIGLARESLGPGMKSGLIWALAFGMASLLAATVLYWGFDIHAVAWIRVKLPETPIQGGIFVLVAGIVSPVAEEIFFRGVLYNALRRFGAFAAITGSTVLFAAAHTGGGVPIIPGIGGLVFACAMERERTLAAPVVIHVLGNLSLFGLSMIRPVFWL